MNMDLRMLSILGLQKKMIKLRKQIQLEVLCSKGHSLLLQKTFDSTNEIAERTKRVVKKEGGGGSGPRIMEMK